MNAVLSWFLHHFKAHALLFTASFQHRSRHFAHISVTWKTQPTHFPVRSQVSYIKFVSPVCPVFLVLIGRSRVLPIPLPLKKGILWTPFYRFSMHKSADRESSLEPRTKGKRKMWCPILYETQFTYVPLRNKVQQEIFKQVHVAMSIYCVPHLL